MKSDEVIKKLEEKMKVGSVDEVFAFWLVVAESYGSWEKMKEEMGDAQTKKLATLFDKFSAVCSEKGHDQVICEGMSVIANGLRLGREPL